MNKSEVKRLVPYYFNYIEKKIFKRKFSKITFSTKQIHSFVFFAVRHLQMSDGTVNFSKFSMNKCELRNPVLKFFFFYQLLESDMPLCKIGKNI